MVQTAGRNDLVGDPIVDHTRADTKMFRNVLYGLFFWFLLVHGWNRVLVPYPRNTGAGKGIALVALESLGVKLGCDLGVGVVSGPTRAHVGPAPRYDASVRPRGEVARRRDLRIGRLANADAESPCHARAFPR